MSEFDSNYTQHDENGVPIVTPEMLIKARKMRCHIIHICYCSSLEVEASSLSIVPFLPRKGDELLDMRGARWICEAVEFRPSLVKLRDGSKAIYQQPTVIAKRPDDNSALNFRPT